ncbi:MAG: DUF6519 domain-containing protein, partial [Pseudomonadota bacterium]|nr:DUF6519 domain-containing protein [Pseudomonadota bacterium]
MSNEDISRLVLQPRKRYSGVRMQQGRVMLDSDWNENEAIDNEDKRRTLMEIVCSKGTPNQGFAVENPVRKEVTPPTSDPVQSYDFALQDGSFYLGGLRHEIETDDPPETFLRQTDWLQIDADAGNLPTPPTSLPGNGVRHDLVYLRGWEQSVSAVEDSELRERALGGPDTSVRRRRMRRIEVLTDVPETCAAAFARLHEELAGPLSPDTSATHHFDDVSCELKSRAR